MGFFDDFFDSDGRQRRDINENRETSELLAGDVRAQSSEIAYLRKTVHELGNALHMLMTMLADKGVLEMAEIREALAPTGGRQVKRIQPTASEVTCVRCGATGMSDRMVKVGADIWCRNCAANP